MGPVLSPDPRRRRARSPLDRLLETLHDLVGHSICFQLAPIVGSADVQRLGDDLSPAGARCD
jgi:hypothetical protein